MGGCVAGQAGQARPRPGTEAMRTGTPSTSLGRGQLERADDEGDQVGGHLYGVGEARPALAVLSGSEETCRALDSTVRSSSARW